jgi:hypothetical protein
VAAIFIVVAPVVVTITELFKVCFWGKPKQSCTNLIKKTSIISWFLNKLNLSIWMLFS